MNVKVIKSALMKIFKKTMTYSEMSIPLKIDLLFQVSTLGEYILITFNFFKFPLFYL